MYTVDLNISHVLEDVQGHCLFKDYVSTLLLRSHEHPSFLDSS